MWHGQAFQEGLPPSPTSSHLATPSARAAPPPLSSLSAPALESLAWAGQEMGPWPPAIRGTAGVSSLDGPLLLSHSGLAAPEVRFLSGNQKAPGAGLQLGCVGHRLLTSSVPRRPGLGGPWSEQRNQLPATQAEMQTFTWSQILPTAPGRRLQTCLWKGPDGSESGSGPCPVAASHPGGPAPGAPSRRNGLHC